jgi:ribosomal protein S18 acetylase RimI-like enzyme
MVSLAGRQRKLQEQLEPRFWRRSPGAAGWTRRYFRFLLVTRRATLLVAEDQGEVAGMLIARRVGAPPVYDPGGASLMIDDFCVLSPASWPSVGAALLEAAIQGSSAAQVIIVAPVRDAAKSQWLASAGLTPVSSWWTRPL